VEICIGLFEASAIASAIKGASTPRPMTHDLLASVVAEMGAMVEKIEVTDLRGSTFFAAIHLRKGDKTCVIDSRPSDAIALALRAGAPIFVEDQVAEKVREAEAQGEPALTGKEKEKWTEFLESLRPEDFGKYKM
jgi:bifunctional DNase/RNase